MKNNYIHRLIEKPLGEHLARGKSILLLGARQTGKTTLLKKMQQTALNYTLLDADTRIRFEKNPSLLRQEIRGYRLLHSTDGIPLVIIDEIQKVPELMDAVQLAIDNQEAQFIITGSSVRKLKRHPRFNLLPGRVINLHLDPLCLLEIRSGIASGSEGLPELEDLLLYGSLPGIFSEKNAVAKQADLESYVTNYLDQEIRAEALVRQLGQFSRFLELAAIESGNPININALSQELGISRYILTDYLRLLEDCLIVERIEPVSQLTTRKRLSQLPKYLFFDLGIRRIAAIEGVPLSSKTMGYLFEQWVGLELRRISRALASQVRLHYFRDHAGSEVDWVIENNKQYIPIEVKWMTSPTLYDARHLIKFQAAYSNLEMGYIICRTPRPVLLTEKILALPWQEVNKIIPIS